MQLIKFVARCSLALLVASGQLVHAALKEEQFFLPVSVTSSYFSSTKTLTHTMVLTVFSEDANPKPAPILVFNHGRAPLASDRANFGRSRYSKTAQFFVERGFIVALPTRIGYGVTGGEDIEDTGACAHKDYPPGSNVGAEQTLAALAFVRQRPDAVQDRAVVVGQSFGGAIAVALASRNPIGVTAAINFAGGGGGNPLTSPKRPCMPQALEKMFADYGKTARVPMLWIYTENDMFFGAEYPRQWHQAFVEQGGKAQFVQFPPKGEDGHSLFTRFPEVWQPVVGEFLDRMGFSKPAAK